MYLNTFHLKIIKSWYIILVLINLKKAISNYNNFKIRSNSIPF